MLGMHYYGPNAGEVLHFFVQLMLLLKIIFLSKLKVMQGFSVSMRSGLKFEVL